MGRYKIGPDPARNFTRVPNDVIGKLDDPMCLGMLVWIMAHHPDRKITQRDVFRRFHVPHQVSYERLRRAWRALEDAGFLHTEDVKDRDGKLRKRTLRTWEPSDGDPKVIGPPEYGNPSNVVRSLHDYRSTVPRSGRDKDVGLKQEDATVAGTREAECPLCKGAGHRRDNPCTRCSSTGRIAL